jgi:hypothetical protein
VKEHEKKVSIGQVVNGIASTAETVVTDSLWKSTFAVKA